MATAASDLFGSRTRSDDVPIEVIPRLDAECSEDNSEENMAGSPTRADSTAVILTELRLMREEAAEDRRLALAEREPVKGKLNGWGQPVLTGLAVFIALFGVQLVPTGISNSEKRVGMLEYKLEQSENRERYKNRDIKLLDAYNRDLYLWLSQQGIKGAPKPPTLSQEADAEK